MKNLLKNSILFILIILLCACSPVKVKPINKYTITNYQNSTRSSHGKTKLTLLITTPIANPGYQTEAMVYVITPYELQHFANHRWVAPPAQLLLPILAQALNNTNYFHAIAEAPFSGNTNYRLDTKLLALEQEFLLPQSQVRVVIQASLLNNNTNQIVASRIFKAIVPTQANNPYSGVLTASMTMNSLAKKIANFVVTNVPRTRYTEHR